jgi:hypothetical protein
MIIQSARTLRANRERLGLPKPVEPASPVAVDVVVPFWSGDSQWLAECVEALQSQRHSRPVIHVISDGCEFPSLPDGVIRYRHNRKAGQGPYRLTNALVAGGHCSTEFLAIQDADDLSLPDRLWRQVSLMEQTGGVMISSGMENFTDQIEMEKKLAQQPLLFPGAAGHCIPRGRCVNSTRTMRLSIFRDLMGFANMTYSGDFEFDNRVRFSGLGKVIDDMAILGRRRLHCSSLSHGVAPMKSERREQALKVIYKHLELIRTCQPCAKKLGAMGTAFGLEVV